MTISGKSSTQQWWNKSIDYQTETRAVEMFLPPTVIYWPMTPVMMNRHFLITHWAVLPSSLLLGCGIWCTHATSWPTQHWMPLCSLNYWAACQSKQDKKTYGIIIIITYHAITNIIQFNSYTLMLLWLPGVDIINLLTIVHFSHEKLQAKTLNYSAFSECITL